MSELLQGYNFVSVRRPLSSEVVWQDIPLKGIHPNGEGAIPTFAYVAGERPMLGRVHTNFEGERVTEIPLGHGEARLLR